jgi:transposase
MWTAKTGAEHDRDELRYPSDLTDAEWQILAPLLPPPAETGRHRSWPMRELMNAIFFVLRGGCIWRMLPGCPSISHRTRRSTAGSPGSATTEPGKTSTTIW